MVLFSSVSSHALRTHDSQICAQFLTSFRLLFLSHFQKMNSLPPQTSQYVPLTPNPPTIPGTPTSSSPTFAFPVLFRPRPRKEAIRSEQGFPRRRPRARVRLTHCQPIGTCPVHRLDVLSSFQRRGQAPTSHRHPHREFSEKEKGKRANRPAALDAAVPSRLRPAHRRPRTLNQYLRRPRHVAAHRALFVYRFSDVSPSLQPRATLHKRVLA